MKVAIIGTWHVHTEEYTEYVVKSDKAELSCVWDTDKERGGEFAKKFSVPFIENYEDILNDDSIDSVIICTATNEHEDVITKAAKANKNIFTEKVLAFTMEEANKMADTIRKSGKKFTISLPHKTFSRVIALKEIADSGDLGEITYMRVRRAHDGASTGWLPPHFFDKEQCGGGAMMDLGAHPMYLLDWFMGKPISISSTFTKVTGKEVEDNAVSTMEFKNGAIGVSETGFVSKRHPPMIEISGTKGWAMLIGDNLSYGTDKTDNEAVVVDNLPEDSLLPTYQWIDAVVNDTEAPFGLDDALNLTNLMEGAYISYEKGIKYIY